MIYIVVVIFALVSGAIGRAELSFPFIVTEDECEEARPVIEMHVARELIAHNAKIEIEALHSWCEAPGVPA